MYEFAYCRYSRVQFLKAMLTISKGIMVLNKGFQSCTD